MQLDIIAYVRGLLLGNVMRAAAPFLDLADDDCAGLSAELKLMVYTTRPPSWSVWRSVRSLWDCSTRESGRHMSVAVLASMISCTMHIPQESRSHSQNTGLVELPKPAEGAVSALRGLTALKVTSRDRCRRELRRATPRQ